MTTFDYTRARATAQSLIRKFGQSATITRKTSSGNAWDPTNSTTGYTCQAVVLNYADNLVDGTRIKASDRMVYVSTEGLSINPTTADTLTVGSITYTIVGVKPLSPGGTVVFWEVQARN